MGTYRRGERRSSSRRSWPKFHSWRSNTRRSARPPSREYSRTSSANKLAWRLSALDLATFIVQSSGSVLGAFQITEWVALTVGVAAVLQSFIEFVQLRNQVTSVNLALRDLQSLSVFWDSLSIVRRRTPGVKQQVVQTLEDSLIMVTDAHTTASSNTISSVAKKLKTDAAEAEVMEE